MTFRPLLLGALMTLGLTPGCNNQQSPQKAGSTNEPGSTVQAPAQPAQPPSEPGSGGTQQAPETAGAPAAGGTVYEVQLSGVRCIAAPCPTHLARPVNQPDADAVQVHELDLSALNMPEERQQALLQRMNEGSVKVVARVGFRQKAGPAGDATVLKVTQLVDEKP
jgi:hypothetical protein